MDRSIDLHKTTQIYFDAKFGEGERWEYSKY